MMEDIESYNFSINLPSSLAEVVIVGVGEM